ncbi:hypothetical protein FQN50_000927 [Emmonsiellopsis sp. PD_5]|nr:hypothetical protein FQN50_000927 [Emmonsiellopsis sp. PD_5]
MEESNELSLSQLCTICHINPPKYKCPRCLTPTCSLPCSKRHKIWSQCSGVRDPAAYLKRKELATPSAFDRDFNFISGIERFVERAERGAERRGVELRRDEVGGGDDGEGDRRRKRVRKEQPVKGEVALMRGLETARVMVIRAPRGMSRAKMNLTGWNKKWRCLSWTVEWVVVDDGGEGRRGISKCLETTRVREAFERSSLAKGMGGGNDMGRGKGRETGEGGGDMLPPPPPPPQPQPSTITIQNEPTPADSRDERARSPTALSHTLSPEPEPKPTTTQPNPQPSASEPDQKHTHTFYLHRPQTPSHLPVLIPIPHPSTTTLTHALRERAVLEFPTFYVLPWTPDALPADRFVLEDVYLRDNVGKEDGEVEGEVEGGSEVDAEGESEVGEDVDLGGVDQGKVLEVLYRDLEGGGVHG